MSVRLPRPRSRAQELGKRRAADDPGELYKLGDPPTGLDGPTEGILVVPLIQGAVDRVVSTLTGGWMPWLGVHEHRLLRAAPAGVAELFAERHLIHPMGG